MKNYGSSIKHYPEREKRRRKWQWIIAFATVCLAVAAGMILITRHREEVLQREDALERERILKDSVAQEEAFRKFCEREEQERLRRKREADMKAAHRRRMEEAHNLAKSKVPSYSWIYLWQSYVNKNWLMHYKRESGNKEHWYMREFNPSTKSFGPEIEVEFMKLNKRNGMAKYTTAYRIKGKKTSYYEISSSDCVSLYEDGELKKEWHCRDLGSYKQIPPTTTSPLARKALRDLERDSRYQYDDYDDSDYDESDEDDYDEDYELYYGR